MKFFALVVSFFVFFAGGLIALATYVPPAESEFKYLVGAAAISLLGGLIMAFAGLLIFGEKEVNE